MPKSAAQQPALPPALPPATLRCFALPASPHMAAAREGVRLCGEGLRADILAHWRESKADLLLLEGAGGLRVPLNEREDMLDLMAALGLPVLLVGGNYLGGLNHMLLSLEAVRRSGLQLAGVALVPSADPSAGCPGVDVKAMLADNAAMLRERLAQQGLQAPVVELPRVPRLNEEGWQTLSGLLAPLARHLLQTAWESSPESAAAALVRRDHELFQQFKQIMAVVLAAILEVRFQFAAADIAFQFRQVVYREHEASFLSEMRQRSVNAWAMASTCRISSRVMSL